jgi:serine/threonine-protein kinase
VKLLHGELLHSEQHVARFLREAEVAKTIQHPGVVGFLAAGVHDDGRPYLVQEFLHGEDMEEALRERSLGLPDILEIGMQLLDALGAVHAVGLVHRDVKPENVFLLHDEFGGLRVKLVDFGVVKVAQDGGAQLTAAGSTVGTPYYMSPEQAQGRVIDARADLWSVGVVLFEALSGRLPFDDENPLIAMTRIVMEPAPSLASRRQDLPTGLVAVVDRALVRNRDARWQTAREMADALRQGVGLK